MLEFQDRLNELEFSDYRGYLASSHWKDFKARYRSSGLPVRCAVCGFKKIQLHHNIYDRLGCEDFGDVTPLCYAHHQAVHKWLTAHGLFSTSTSVAVAAIRNHGKKFQSRLKAKLNKVYPNYCNRIGSLRLACKNLQALATAQGRPNFFLGCRDVGIILGVSKSTGNRLLKRLQVNGELLEISIGKYRGHGKTSPATEWRYLSSDLPRDDSQ